VSEQQQDCAYFPALAEPVSLSGPLADGRMISDVIPDRRPSAQDRLETRERAVAIRNFVLGLPERDQNIVYAVFWMGRSQAEVARDLGVSRMAVCKALSKISERGRVALAGFTDFACVN
jgi:RNA polymerase sigma factor (sigma-70 family)